MIFRKLLDIEPLLEISPSKTFLVIPFFCIFKVRLLLVSFRTQGGEPKEDSISCMRHNLPCQYQDGERFPQTTKERRYLKMIKGVQAVKGELSELDKQLSDPFLREVSLILC